MKPILQVEDLTYIYSIGTPFEHKALDQVSFSINPGEFVGIIGHTGSGKSTLMQQLNGLLKPTSGRVLLDGQDIWSDKKLTRAARFRVGLVFSIPSISSLKRRSIRTSPSVQPIWAFPRKKSTAGSGRLRALWA